MGGPIEQLGDIERDEIIGGGQFALGEALQRCQGGLDPTLGSDHVPHDLFALLVAQFEGGEHFEVGPHGCQRCAQFMRGDCGEVPRRFQRGPGTSLLITDPGEHALHCVADLNRLPHPADLHLLGFGLRIDGASLLGQQPERIDHDQGEEPPDHHGAGDHTRTDDQHPPVQLADPALGFGHRSPQCDRRPAHGEGANAVLDAVDGGVGIPLGKFRQHDIGGHRHRHRAHSHGTNQIAIRAGGAGCRRSGQQGGEVAQAAHRVQAAVQLAVLVVGDAHPYPDSEREHQYHHGQRGDDHDGAQRQHTDRQPLQQSVDQFVGFHQGAQEAAFSESSTVAAISSSCSIRVRA